MKTALDVALEVILLMAVAAGMPAEAQKTAGEAYKNVVALRDIPEDEFTASMTVISGSLGVVCTYCHNPQMEDDSKPAKLTARRMIQMTRKINESSFGGKPVVTCNTCHQGSTHPNGMAALWNKTPEQIAALKQAMQSPAGTAPPKTAAPGNLPALEEVLARYRKLAGNDAVRSIHAVGVMSGDLTPARTLTADAVFPGRFVLSLSMAGNDMKLIVNDGRARSITPAGATELTPQQETQVSRGLMDLLHPVKFLSADARREVIGVEQIGDREYVRVDSNTATRIEHLYFDQQTGLLHTVRTDRQTPLGVARSELILEDYRETGGAQLPFRITTIALTERIVYKFSAIELNVPLDSSRFDLPAAK
jgi:hypothetical protein